MVGATPHIRVFYLWRHRPNRPPLSVVKLMPPARLYTSLQRGNGCSHFEVNVQDIVVETWGYRIEIYMQPCAHILIPFLPFPFPSFRTSNISATSPMPERWKARCTPRTFSYVLEHPFLRRARSAYWERKLEEGGGKVRTKLAEYELFSWRPIRQPSIDGITREQAPHDVTHVLWGLLSVGVY
jgi:hypothetical protein